MKINVWSFPKHESIKLLLIELQTRLGEDSFCYEKVEEEDCLGVWLLSPVQDDIKAYIHRHGQRDDMYGVHLEYPSFNSGNSRDELQIFEDQSVEQVIHTLAIHFEVCDVQSVL